MILNKITIISGGQSGVDRAALDFALKNNIKCGGWCPLGRIAEDGYIENKYPLVETSTSDYNQRTRKNIEDSDGTLVLYSDFIDSGTILTKDICMELGKPFLEINLVTTSKFNVSTLAFWLKDNNISILNIAGPRESSSPDIYKQTLRFLEI